MFPENAREIIRQSALKHPTDIRKAYEDAVRGMRLLSNKDEVDEALREEGLMSFLYQARHRWKESIHAENQEFRRPEFSTNGRKVAAIGEATLDMFKHMLSYQVLGRTLATIKKKEIPGLVENLKSRSKAYLLDANFLIDCGEELENPEDSIAKLSETKVRRIWEKAKSDMEEVEESV
jgi:hypothetical protein